MMGQFSPKKINSGKDANDFYLKIYFLLQKAGIEFGMEQTARLLTRLDPKKEGFINYT